jgi:hypothetical protein
VAHQHHCARFSASAGGIAVFAHDGDAQFVQLIRSHIDTSIASAVGANVAGYSNPNRSIAEQIVRPAVAAKFARHH